MDKNESKITLTSDKKERFVRLAEYRTNLILDRVRVLGNCSNRSAYDYNEEQVNKIFGTIDKALREARAKFTFRKRDKNEFTL